MDHLVRRWGFYICAPICWRRPHSRPPPFGETAWRLAIFSDVSHLRILCPLPLGGEGGPPPAFSSVRQPTGPGEGISRLLVGHSSPLQAQTDALLKSVLGPKPGRKYYVKNMKTVLGLETGKTREQVKPC